MVRRTVRALLALLVLVLAGCSQLGLSEPEPAVAQEVKGTGGPGGAPTLETGEYTDAIGPGQRKYYALKLADGVRPYVTATLDRPLDAFGEGIQDGVAVGLETADGVRCGTAGERADQVTMVDPVTVAAAPEPVGTDPWTAPFDQSQSPSCGRPGTYALWVEWEEEGANGSDPVPLDLTVLLEPPARSSGLPDPASTDGPGSGSVPAVPDFTGKPDKTTSGRTYGDAGALRSTTVVSDTIESGQTLYWRVKVGWGQRISYAVRFAPCGQQSSTQIGSWVLNPLRVGVKPIDPGGNASYYDGAGEESAVIRNSTVPVSYRNRDQAEDEAVAPTGIAGWYYIAVRLNADEALGGASVPVQLAVTVSGGRTGVPDYRSAEGAASPDVLLAESTAGGAPVRVVRIGLVGGGVVLLLVAVAVVLLPGRRRRT